MPTFVYRVEKAGLGKSRDWPKRCLLLSTFAYLSRSARMGFDLNQLVDRHGTVTNVVKNAISVVKSVVKTGAAARDARYPSGSAFETGAVEQWAELADPGEDLAGAAVEGRGRPRRRPCARIGQGGGDQGGLVAAEVRRRLHEIGPRHRLGAVESRSGFGDVEVDLENPPLAPQKLDLRGEPRLEDLAHRIAPRPEQDVLRRLHGDGAGAAGPFAGEPHFDLLAERLEVEAMVFAETIVLGGDDGGSEVNGDPFQRHPGSFDPLAFGETDQHQRRDRRIDETVGDDDQRRCQNQDEQHASQDAPQPAGDGRPTRRSRPPIDPRRGARRDFPSTAAHGRFQGCSRTRLPVGMTG